MAFLGPNNALAWAHFRLRGGWKRSLTFTIGASIVLAGIIYSGVHFDKRASTTILAGWSTALLSLNAFIMVIYAAGRISAAVRTDIQTKTIESHRLMPTAPMEAIAGYISGAALQPLVLCAAAFLMGVWTTAAAGMDVMQWVIAHVVLLGFSILVWSMAAYVAFTARLGPALLFLPILMGPAAMSGGAASALPGVMVIVSPILGQSIFDLRSAAPGMATLPAPYALALAAQFYFAAIFFVAAARRYRVVDGVGIDSILGLLLVAGWVGSTAIGFASWADFRPRAFRAYDAEPAVKVISSLAVGLAIALAPVAAAAWSSRRWSLYKRQTHAAPMRRPFSPPFVIALAAIMVVLIPWFGMAGTTLDKLYTLIILLITFTSVYFLCAWAYLSYERAGIAILIWTVLTFGVPIAVDLVRYGLAESGEITQIAGISTLSPIGALIVIWDHHEVNVVPGLWMQAMIGALPVFLWGMVALKRRDREKAIAPAAPAL